MSDEWDRRFLNLAKEISNWSKDPSTKVGAVIVRPDKTVASIGYNGFPRGCDDSIDIMNDRERKLMRTVHAEVNAIVHCRDQYMNGYIIYVWPMMPCSNCAALIIQSGIDRVVTVMNSDVDRWKKSFEETKRMFSEAGVKFDFFEKSA